MREIALGTGGNPRAIGVVYTDLNGIEHTAMLNGEGDQSEVILSAGSLGSPQLLMLSGIGPPQQLTAFDIPIVVNQTEVGQTMADNSMHALWVMTREPAEISSIRVVGITTAGTYIEVASGQMQQAVLQLPTTSSTTPAASSNNDTNTQQSTTRLSGAQQLDARILNAIFSVPAAYVSAAAQGGAVIQKVQGPYSHGELRLVTKNVSDNPSVRFNYFQRQEDLDACTAGQGVFFPFNSVM